MILQGCDPCLACGNYLVYNKLVFSSKSKFPMLNRKHGSFLEFNGWIQAFQSDVVLAHFETPSLQCLLEGEGGEDVR